MKTKEQTPEMKKLAVLVAKDVQRSMAKDDLNVRARTGYVMPSYDTTETSIREKMHSDNTLAGNSKRQAKYLKKTCTVCGIGACVLSLISINNNYKFSKRRSTENGIMSRFSIVKKLKDCFTEVQINQIESAFESNPWDGWNQKCLAAAGFGQQYYDPDQRLNAIMQHIIDNKGTINFDPNLALKYSRYSR